VDGLVVLGAAHAGIVRGRVAGDGREGGGEEGDSCEDDSGAHGGGIRIGTEF
jgi:hypothetical protein